MLCLSRKQDERIFIDGGRIIISVVRIDGDKVRLGFEAAKEVLIDREEIMLRRQSGERNRENR